MACTEVIDPFVGRCDALLKFTHFRRQRRLVSHRRRHAAQQRGHFRARLRESENIVDEEQHVLPFVVAEVLRRRQSGQSHAQSGAGRFSHLTVDQGGLVDDAGLLHFEPQVVSFTRAFAHAGEHGNSTVLGCDVVDQFLNDDGLSDAGAAKQVRSFRP